MRTNIKVRAIPRVTDKSFLSKYRPGDAMEQDLAFMGKDLAADGKIGFSNIVDRVTRRLSTAVITKKSQAVDHLREYLRTALARMNWVVKEAHTDKGGEFIGEDYTVACRENGIVHSTGAPETPESQGKIERANQTVKRNLLKVMIDTNLPSQKVWYAFLPGVTAMINSTVHSATGKAVYSQEKLAPLGVGDYIFVKVPESPREMMDGYFGGFLSNNKAMVVAAPRNSTNYKVYEVHPTAIKLMAMRGSDRYVKARNNADAITTETKTRFFEDCWGDLDDEVHFEVCEDDDALTTTTPGNHNDKGPSSGPRDPDNGKGGGSSSSEGPTRCLSPDLNGGGGSNNNSSSGGAAGSGVPSGSGSGVSPSDVAGKYGKGQRVLFKDPETGAYFPGQVIKQGKKNFELTRNFVDAKGYLTGKVELVDKVPAVNIVKTFDLVNGSLPADVRGVLSGTAAAEDRSGGVFDAASEASEAAAEDDPPAAAADDDFSEAESCDVVPQAVMAVAIKGGKSEVVAYQALDENAAKGHLKVTREDIKNGTHNQAQLKELKSWKDHGVLGELVKVDRSTQFIQAWWVNTWKKTPEGREAKSRLVVDGSRDYRDLSVITTYAGTGIMGQLRSTDVYALHKFKGPKKMAITDVNTAFIRSAANEHFLVKVKMPPTLPSGAEKLGFVPGGVYKQVKAIYGLSDAPRCFHELLKSELKAREWDEIANSIWVRKDKQGSVEAIVSSHVDDLFARADDAAARLANLGEKLGITKISTVEEGKTAVYTGCDIVLNGDEMRISKKSYADSIEVPLSAEKKKKKLTPEDFKVLMQLNREVDLAVQKQQQNAVGQLGWLASMDYRVAAIFAMCAATNHQPNADTLEVVLQALHYAKVIHKEMVYKGVKDPVILGWSDANFNTSQSDSRLGWIIQVVDRKDITINGTIDTTRAPYHNFVHWRTTKPGRAVGSSSVAELLAFRELVKEVPLISSVINKLYGGKAAEYYMCDNKAVIDWCHSRYMSSDYQWQGVLKQVLDDLGAEERGPVEVRWVPTKEQRADVLTKFVPYYK